MAYWIQLNSPDYLVAIQTFRLLLVLYSLLNYITHEPDFAELISDFLTMLVCHYSQISFWVWVSGQRKWNHSSISCWEIETSGLPIIVLFPTARRTAAWQSKLCIQGCWLKQVILSENEDQSILRGNSLNAFVLCV